MRFFSTVKPGAYPPDDPAAARTRPMRGWSRRELALGGAAVAALAGWARTPVQSAPRLNGVVEIGEMTWVDVRDAIAAGYRTAIVPSGGLEQNGPHMIIAKHDYIVRWAARRIAMELGDALVAPVVSYVPEGSYTPPGGNMRYPGTIGVPDDVFAGVLEGIARSLRSAGFTTICYISDHGGSVRPQAELVARLTAEWQGGGVRVVDVGTYYADAAETAYLAAQGLPESAQGQHAGIADTAELMAVHAQGVDFGRLPASSDELQRLGGSGEPRQATFERGDAMMALKVTAAVRQIQAARAQA